MNEAFVRTSAIVLDRGVVARAKWLLMERLLVVSHCAPLLLATMCVCPWQWMLVPQYSALDQLQYLSLARNTFQVGRQRHQRAVLWCMVCVLGPLVCLPVCTHSYWMRARTYAWLVCPGGPCARTHHCPRVQCRVCWALAGREGGGSVGARRA